MHTNGIGRRLYAGAKTFFWLTMQLEPINQNRNQQIASLLRSRISTLGPKPGKNVSLSLLVDANDLFARGISGLETSKEGAVRPVGTHTFFDVADKSAKVGVTGWRRFQRRMPFGLMVSYVTPCSTVELAEKYVEITDEMFVHGLKSIPKIIQRKKLEDIVVEGLTNVYAYEESRVDPRGVYSIRLLSSHVNSVLFSIQMESLEDSWSWVDVARVASAQAEKIRSNLNLLKQLFRDSPH